MSKYCWAAALLFGLSLLGCSGKSSDCTVSGTVMFDNQPVPDGDIVFRDAEDKVAPGTGKIKDGKFTFPVKPGKKKVQIFATRLMKVPPEKTDALPPGIPGMPGAKSQTERPLNYIPMRYNTTTELTADVTADGPNQYEFKLTSR